jgi:prophage regulatory protein
MAIINRKFIKLPEVIDTVGKSRSSIYMAIKKGEFPAPVRIGARAVAWTSESIALWQDACVNTSNAA